MRPQSTVSYLGWFQSFFQANHLGSVLALSFSLFLAACGGGGNTGEYQFPKHTKM